MSEEEYLEELAKQMKRLADATKDHLVAIYARIAALEAQVKDLQQEKANG